MAALGSARWAPDACRDDVDDDEHLRAGLVSWVVRDVASDGAAADDDDARLERAATFQRARDRVEAAASSGTLEDVEDFLDDVERFALPEMTSSQVATLLSFEEALSNAHLLLGRFRARVAARRAALEGVTRWRRGVAPRPKARFFPVDQEWAAARVAAFLPSADWRRLASACRALRAGLG